MHANKSAEPDLEVEALLPCLERRRREEARMEEVVEMLKVLWESPPVPTMSHLFFCFFFYHGINVSERSYRAKGDMKKRGWVTGERGLR